MSKKGAARKKVAHVLKQVKEVTTGESEISLERIEFCRDRYTLINHTTAEQDVLACSYAEIYDKIQECPIVQQTPKCDGGTRQERNRQRIVSIVLDRPAASRFSSSLRTGHWRKE
jgi:hypothetical protein